MAPKRLDPATTAASEPTALTDAEAAIDAESEPDTDYATDTESEPDKKSGDEGEADEAANLDVSDAQQNPAGLPGNLSRVALFLGNFKKFPDIATFPENRRYLTAPPSHPPAKWKGALKGDVIGPLLALRVGEDMYDPMAGWVLGSSRDDDCDLRLSKDNRFGVSRKHLRFDFELASKRPRITVFSRNRLRILVHQAAGDRVVILQKGESLTIRTSNPITVDFGWHSFQAWCPILSPDEESQYCEYVEKYFDDCLNSGGNTLALETPSGAETALTRQGKNGAVYMAGEYLGKGRLSVRLVRDITTGKYFAAKEPRWRSTDSASTVLSRWEDYKTQYALLQKLRHPHIVKVVELLLDKKQPPWLVMEYVQDNLDTVLMGLQLTHRLVVLSQLLQAVAHIHARGFVHLDIKPSNILVQWDGNELVVKLADVDTTKTTKTVATMTTFVGTPVYMAPEIWRHEGPSGKPTDMWTVGLVALQLFTTWRPEQDKSWIYGEHGIIHNMLGHDVWIRDVLMGHVATAPSYIQPLLEALIREGPKARWTAEEAFDWMEKNAQSRKRPKRKRDSSAGRLEIPRETRSEAPSFSSDLAEWAQASIPVVWVPPSPVAGSESFGGEEGPVGKDHGSPGTDFSQAVPPWQPRAHVAPEPVSSGTTPTERAGAVPSPSLPDTLSWGSVSSSSKDGGREVTPIRQASSLPSPSLPDTAPWGSVPATPADGAGASSEAEY